MNRVPSPDEIAAWIEEIEHIHAAFCECHDVDVSEMRRKLNEVSGYLFRLKQMTPKGREMTLRPLQTGTIAGPSK